MADVVLVHGAWHGAWCWRRLLPGLWQAGHRVFAVDLTGLGARRHLFRPDIGLTDHINDVVATLEAEELQQAVVVGHSYAGMVITGVADRCAAQLAALVYLDAVVPESGESWSSTHTAATQAERRAQIAEHGGLVPPDPSAFGLQGADRDWVLRRQSLHPGACYDEPLHFNAARWSGLRRHFIDCQSPALPTIAASRQRAQTQPGWRLDSLQTGHDAMISAPDALASLLSTLLTVD
ncbi:MAG TPA: alpha/beta hydrolase [Ideonella sp.]|uniref:alpha/beta fold hydrolase n=1 Tax=Ideonella sp. TaxID=1929293 RepID=UPI002E315BF0|nr:alpha/beta hydrolase [Ideonella sp.]HEX5688101.1 alpha/beta hydrolase [Ideonella sp.]